MASPFRDARAWRRAGPAGAHLAEHHRIDDFEVRRIGGEREVYGVAVELAVGGRAQMILTSPEPSTSSVVAEPPLNSWKMTRCSLPMTCASTFMRPRCAMPSTISLTPSAPPRLMICSSAGIIDSPPSRPKRLVPVNFRSQKFSKPSASTSLLRIARLPSRVKLISLSGPSMRSWIQPFCAPSEMCRN